MSASVVESVLEKPPPSLVGLELPLRMQIHMPLRMRLPMRLMMLRDRQIYIRLITLTVPDFVGGEPAIESSAERE